jgi:nitroreductase
MVNICIAIESIASDGAICQIGNIMKLNDTSSVLAFLKSRKSASAKTMTGPGPSQSQIDEILEIAVRVPDHGKLAPWRFVLIEGEGRARVGEGFAQVWSKNNPSHGGESLNFQLGLFMRAPLILIVVSTAAANGKIPVWEQQLSSAAVCYSAVLAATALGFDVQWQSDWVAYDDGAKAVMGVHAHEKVSGIIYIGTSNVPLEDRPRPDVSTLLTRINS